MSKARFPKNRYASNSAHQVLFSFDQGNLLYSLFSYFFQYPKNVLLENHKELFSKDLRN